MVFQTVLSISPSACCGPGGWLMFLFVIVALQVHCRPAGRSIGAERKLTCGFTRIPPMAFGTAFRRTSKTSMTGGGLWY